MALRKAPLPIQFSGGVDNRTDPKQVESTKLIDLQNGVFTRLTTISKRNGYRALSTQIQNGGGTIADARGLAIRDSERLLFTDKRCFSYRPSSDRWADSGEVAASTATTLPIARTGSYQTQPDVADRNGIRVVAWEDSRGGVWCSVFEATTGRILLSQTQLDASASAKDVRCIAVGDFLHVLWTRADLKQVQLALINPATPAVAPVVSAVVTDLGSTRPFWDACECPLGPNNVIDQRPGLIAWSQDGGGYRVGYIAPDGTLGSPLNGYPSVKTLANTMFGPIAICYDPIAPYVATIWIDGPTTLKAHVFTPSTLTAQVHWVNVATTTGVYSRIALAVGSRLASGFGALWWVAEVTGSRTDLCSVDSGFLDPVSGLPSSFTTLKGHCLVSRAWHDGSTLTPAAIDGDAYVMVASSSRFFPYVAALRLSDDSGINSPSNTIVSRLMPGEAAGSLMRTTGSGTRAWTQFLPTVTQQDVAATDIYSRSHAVCIPYRIQLSSQNGDQFSEQGIKLATIGMKPSYQTAQLGRGLYLSSSAPMHYDGDAWHEADFHTAPDFGFDATGAPVSMTTAVTIGAAGAIPDGTYLYAYWYEAVDAQGELHRGAVSVKLLVTMTGGPKKFSHAIPTCRLSRFNNVRICVARSEVGATGTDETIELFKVTSNDVTITTGDNCYLNNSFTVDTVTFVDNLTDAQLTTREPLYTNGGILSNDPAPWSGGIIAVSKSRLYWTDTTDPNVVRYSQQIADDTALEAPIGLSLRVDPYGGPITAIGALDDTIIPFKETATFVFGGPGPLADPSVNPEVNTFSSVELLTSDVGCISPASLGQTPLGITFQSRKGIKLLTRQRQIADIGGPVSALDDQHYTRTTLLPDRKAIVYLTDTADGFSLLWDYDRNQWSKFSNHLGIDAIVVDGIYHYLRLDSRVFQETPGIYIDDNSRIPLRIETAWIHYAQYLQGWQRIIYAYFLGRWISPHTFSVRYRIDYNDAYSAANLSDVNTNWNPSVYGGGSYGVGSYGGSGGSGTRYQRRIHLNKRCQAMSFLIEDIEAPGDFGASFELSEMLLIGGGLGPDFKVGAARSA
jgi:hypothetical protein